MVQERFEREEFRVAKRSLSTTSSGFSNGFSRNLRNGMPCALNASRMTFSQHATFAFFFTMATVTSLCPFEATCKDVKAAWHFS